MKQIIDSTLRTVLEDFSSDLVIVGIDTLTIETSGGKFIWQADSFIESTIEPCNCNIFEAEDTLPECPICKRQIRLYRDRNIVHKNGIHHHGYCV